MSRFQSMSQERLEDLQLGAYSVFGPLLLKEALQRLCRLEGTGAVEKFERSMIDRIDTMQAEVADLELKKELAIEQLTRLARDVRDCPNTKQDCEDVTARRNPDRSETSGTLEEQLQAGLEDTFPASDPPAVVSTSISGGAGALVGTEEVLRQRKEEEVLRQRKEQAA